MRKTDWMAEWITTSRDTGSAVPEFRKRIELEKKAARVTIAISALGVYEALLNGSRISDYVLAPGWTSYETRLQYQVYDITELMREKNELIIKVGKGWMRSPMPGWIDNENFEKKRRMMKPCGLIAQIEISWEDGTTQVIGTDDTWKWKESEVRFSEIYDGEIYDATFVTDDWINVKYLKWPKNILIPQEGNEIKELDRITVKDIIRTPKGEYVIDFGQEITGYVEFTVRGRNGDKISFTHGEMLDKDGNFYNENYRSAKARVEYTCKDGEQTYHPSLTFFGFRYLKILEYPGKIRPSDFVGISVGSDIRRTGYLRSGNEKINQLFSNIIWGQKDNFLDVPTDCPQRDERLGWTGDAQVFIKAASYNYDVEKFFIKWLHDLAADQREDGSVGQVIPDYLPDDLPSAGWGDAAVICPWQIYMTYGNLDVLQEQFSSMKKWVDYITNITTTQYLWTGAPHCFGDWLGLDAPSGSYKGASRDELICTAFYAYSVEILIKAGHVLGKKMSEYEELYKNIVLNFQREYPILKTQTEHVLAIYFHLASDLQKTADNLADMIQKDGGQLRTGFIGTPYILHVLSDYGYENLAYQLLLREEYPSWLFSVNQGATTIWEHWDGIMEDGKFWNSDMNSFNHYAYGAVADWVYEKAAGIRALEEFPGFSKVKIAPLPDKRLSWLSAEINTRHGKISSLWRYEKNKVRYEISTAVPANICIADQTYEVEPGEYIFWN